MAFDRETKRISTLSGNVLRVADFYRRNLAKIDTPAYKANREHAMMLHGQLSAIDQTMTALFGNEQWQRIQTVAGNLAYERGENYLDMQKRFAELAYDLPMVEDIDHLVPCQGKGGTNDPRCGRAIGHAGPCDWCD